MSIKNILKISIMILFAFVFNEIALSSGCGNPPVITSPNDNEVYLAGGTFTDLCKASGDAVITWSGSGSFDPTTGSCSDWTAPGTTGTVTLTATNSSGSDQVKIKTADIIYVDEDATAGNNDGTSWADAFLDLQDGLSAASSGNHIWVAEGTYKPGAAKLDTFHLVPGVKTYGGFDPTTGDDTWAERDYINNVTTLSGDIDNDGLDNGNSYFVVTANDVTIDGSTRLDGFTITMGWSYHYLCDGAGMKIEDCDPNVANCIFKENRAPGGDGDGGGMGCLNASPEVTNCIFIDNIAGDDGGALVNTKGSNGTFINCVFYSNNTNGENVKDGQGKSNGGAIWNTRGEDAGQAGSSPTFINCLIAGNSTVPGSHNGGKNGGGVANKGEDTNPVFINCTFTGNTANWDGGGMCTKDDAEATVINCIFWDNEVGSGYSGFAICDKDDGVTNVSFSDLDQSGYTGNNNNISQDPDFVDSSDPDGADNEFLTDDDGLRLIGWRRSFSPCIDSGNNTPVTESYDIIGKTRIVDGNDDSTATVDMGAYEFTNTDTDSDGMPDWWEVTYGLDPTDSTGSNGADGDGDSDNWRNIVEYLLRTEPDNGSSDGEDRMPAGWTSMEIEAKWTMSQSTFNSLQSDFWDGRSYSATGTTYDIDWKWSGAQKRFWDFYYDNSGDDISDALHCFRKRRRLSSPYNDPANRDYQRVQFKSDPYRFGATWLRLEHEDDNLSDAAAANIVEGDSTTWAAIPQPYDTIVAVLTDHPSFDESTLDDFLEIDDYRYKIDFEISNVDYYTMSLDYVTSTYSGESPEQFYELEIEIIPMPHTAAQVEELFRILAEMEADYTLTPSTTSKGGIEVPESF